MNRKTAAYKLAEPSKRVAHKEAGATAAYLSRVFEMFKRVKENDY